MAKSYSKSYAEAGVNIEAGYEGVKLMSEHVKKTHIPGVLSDIGGFGGLFQPDLSSYEEPVFVSGTDGVGTKIRIAQLLDKHNTIGVDCVAMCVNDIICCGAKPLFFLDYIAIGKNDPVKVASIVEGVAQGCVDADCALIGGETAEHPGVMNEDDYDLAGLCVGVVDKKKIIEPSLIKEGDVLLALPSTGFHSNGYSLVRKVFDVENNLDKDLGEKLLTPTKIYVKTILEMIEKADVHGISHITGGGLIENLPRMIPDGYCASIDINKIKTPDIFNELSAKANIDQHDMYNTFNMGVGMIVAVDKESVEKAKEGNDAYEIGVITKGEEKIVLW